MSKPFSWPARRAHVGGSARARQRPGRSLHLESLEVRQVLAVTATFANHRLDIVGDAANDTVLVTAVDVGGVAQVRVNGQAVGSGVNAAEVTTLVADLGAGDDTMDLSALDLTAFTGLTDGAITINGGAGNDTLTGSPLGDVLLGGDGNDTLVGGPGNDSLLGGNGNDTLIGGAGDDVLDGGLNDDSYSFSGTASLGWDTIVQPASSNVDTLVFTNLGGGITIDIASTAAQVVRAGQLTLTLSDGLGIDNVQGTAYADTIYGNDNANKVIASSGNDVIYGRGGNDWLDGGAGNDVIYGEGGDDTLFGKTGNDALFGGDGNDVLYGNEGNDSLAGGAGDDSYTLSTYGAKTIDEAVDGGDDRIDIDGVTLTAYPNLDSTTVQTLTSSLSIQFLTAGVVEWFVGGAQNDQSDTGVYGNGIYTVPGPAGSTTMVVFRYGLREASYDNPFYVYKVADGPGDPVAGEPIFIGGATKTGDAEAMWFKAGTQLAFFIDQNGNSAARFYSIPALNVLDGGADHVSNFAARSNEMQLGWEDLYHTLPNPGGYLYDGDFNDIVVGITAYPETPTGPAEPGCGCSICLSEGVIATPVTGDSVASSGAVAFGSIAGITPSVGLELNQASSGSAGLGAMASTGEFGTGWSRAGVARLVMHGADPANPDYVSVVFNGVNARVFRSLPRSSGTPTFARANGVATTDTFTLENNQYVFRTANGDTYAFNTFATSVPSLARGALVSQSDASGNRLEFTFNGDGSTALLKSFVPGQATPVEVQEYVSLAAGNPNAGKVARIDVRQGDGTLIRSVGMGYYDGTSSFGELGQLATVLLPSNLESPRARVSLPFPPEDSIP